MFSVLWHCYFSWSALFLPLPIFEHTLYFTSKALSFRLLSQSNLLASSYHLMRIAFSCLGVFWIDRLFQEEANFSIFRHFDESVPVLLLCVAAPTADGAMRSGYGWNRDLPFTWILYATRRTDQVLHQPLLVFHCLSAWWVSILLPTVVSLTPSSVYQCVLANPTASKTTCIIRILADRASEPGA